MVPISIIIPCYQMEATLARTLESCLIQPDAAQIIVVDDGSTDRSADITRHYRQRDARVQLLQMTENGGIARARNWAAIHASEDLLAFIDADDEYRPGALAAACQYLQRYPHEASVRLDVEFAGFPRDIVEHPEFARCSAILSNTIPSSLVIRRAVYRALGGFPMGDFFRRAGCEDGAFSWALSKLFGNRRLIDARRVIMHYHPGIHAERYFRVHMGMLAPVHQEVEQALHLSRQFVADAEMAIAQLRGLSGPPGPPGPV
ncbi:glycosyltransferase family 2 protein [Paraburkholderia sp. GAS41]|uniref:glycosyltransferase family 2 protein n=1 Tax=Paraburkholderia sp. GAS41 TaxID=3035134 RepID=UPI003D1ABD44